MSIKIVKSVRQLGQASVEGLSFPAAIIVDEIKAAFEATQREANRLGFTTRPAVIKIIVEQEVITDDVD